MSDSLFEMLGIPGDEIDLGKRATPQTAPAKHQTPKATQSQPETSSVLPPIVSFLMNHYPQRSNASNPKLFRFQIDDRKPHERTPSFCEITAIFPDTENDHFTLELTHPPYNEALHELVEQLGGEWTHAVALTTLAIRFALKKQRPLRDFANAVARVASVRHVRRTGDRYYIRDWKWVAPRTSRAIHTFAAHVWQFRGERAATKRKAVQK